jgi:hypothetical protein
MDGVGFVAGSFLVFTFCERENNSIGAAGQKIPETIEERTASKALAAAYCGALKVFPQLMETRDTLTILRAAG